MQSEERNMLPPSSGMKLCQATNQHDIENCISECKVCLVCAKLLFQISAHKSVLHILICGM
jgi:hypothetical protein